MKRKRTFIKFISIFILSLVLVVGFSTKILQVHANAEDSKPATKTYNVVVTASALNVRSGPGTNYNKIGLLYNGDEVEVLDTKDGWYKIAYNNKDAYISSAYTIKAFEENIKADSEILVNKVTANALNVRSGPGTDYDKIGVLLKNEVVNIISNENGWLKISFNDNEGYISSRYIVEDELVTNDHIIIINSKSNTLNYYYEGKIANEYECATGKSRTPTPCGLFTICNKIKNRPYYKLGIPGGADNNPLGKRWLGLSIGNTNGNVYAIHGNADESSIGKNISAGCIRMHNKEVEALYEIVPIGTIVIITDKEILDADIAAKYGYTIE